MDISVVVEAIDLNTLPQRAAEGYAEALVKSSTEAISRRALGESLERNSQFGKKTLVPSCHRIRRKRVCQEERSCRKRQLSPERQLTGKVKS